jgi:hypothetical protein
LNKKKDLLITAEILYEGSVPHIKGDFNPANSQVKSAMAKDCTNSIKFLSHLWYVPD